MQSNKSELELKHMKNTPHGLTLNWKSIAINGDIKKVKKGGPFTSRQRSRSLSVIRMLDAPSSPTFTPDPIVTKTRKDGTVYWQDRDDKGRVGPAKTISAGLAAKLGL